MDKPMRILAWPAGLPGEQNPYARMMYSAFLPPLAEIIPFAPLMRRVPMPDIFHLQWPEGIFEGRGGSNLALAAAKAWRILHTAKAVRRGGGAVVLTAHNLAPHASLNAAQAALWRWFQRQLLAQTDLIVSLSRTALDEYRRHHPAAGGIEAEIVPHPHYRDAYPRVDRLAARRAWGVGQGPLLGIIGSLRPSKGVVEAVQAFRQAAGDDAGLLLAGACDDAYGAAITAAIDGDPRITFRAGALSDAEIASAFAAIDACLINQAGTLNSGTALLALSQDRPVIAPDVGSLREWRDTLGAEWVKLFAPPLDAAHLRATIAGLAPPSTLGARLDMLSPDVLSRQLLAAFTRILHRA